MSAFGQMMLFLLVTALVQNLVLTTGFGTSIMLRVIRRPGDIWVFGGLLTGFSVLTVLAFYPLDRLLGTGWAVKMLRPAVIIVIAAGWYLAVTLVTRRWMPEFYQRTHRLMPLAALNNVVVGIALVINYQFEVGILSAVGLALGSCGGFLLLSWLTAEGMERLDNPDMPHSFRGLPATLVYMGILALALMGFNRVFNFF